MNMNAQSDTLVCHATSEVLDRPSEQAVTLTREPKQFPRLEWKPTPLWKRAIDVVVSSILLFLLSPALLAIAIYIRSVSRGRVIFRQSRLGEMGHYFTIYKFRTMNACDPHLATSQHRAYVSSLAESDEVVSKPDHTKRLIPGGAFLRRTSIDELPQLFNVLLGNMSLIGPRPDVLDWTDYSTFQLHRFEVKPGITGLWQVSGKNRLSFSRMIELDIEYVNRRSFWFDIWIAFKTVKMILTNDNC
jgi:lipopolysaccharide/colanic/teichoic acid biosynthesis glycosyltransferase